MGIDSENKRYDEYRRGEYVRAIRKLNEFLEEEIENLNFKNKLSEDERQKALGYLYEIKSIVGKSADAPESPEPETHLRAIHNKIKEMFYEFKKTKEETRFKKWLYQFFYRLLRLFEKTKTQAALFKLEEIESQMPAPRFADVRMDVADEKKNIVAEWNGYLEANSIYIDGKSIKECLKKRLEQNPDFQFDSNTLKDFFREYVLKAVSAQDQAKALRYLMENFKEEGVLDFSYSAYSKEERDANLGDLGVEKKKNIQIFTENRGFRVSGELRVCPTEVVLAPGYVELHTVASFNFENNEVRPQIEFKKAFIAYENEETKTFFQERGFARYLSGFKEEVKNPSVTHFSYFDECGKEDRIVVTKDLLEKVKLEGKQEAMARNYLSFLEKEGGIPSPLMLGIRDFLKRQKAQESGLVIDSSASSCQFIPTNRGFQLKENRKVNFKKNAGSAGSLFVEATIDFDFVRMGLEGKPVISLEYGKSSIDFDLRGCAGDIFISFEETTGLRERTFYRTFLDYAVMCMEVYGARQEYLFLESRSFDKWPEWSSLSVEEACKEIFGNKAEYLSDPSMYFSFTGELEGSNKYIPNPEVDRNFMRCAFQPMHELCEINEKDGKLQFKEAFKKAIQRKIAINKLPKIEGDNINERDIEKYIKNNEIEIAAKIDRFISHLPFASSSMLTQYMLLTMAKLCGSDAAFSAASRYCACIPVQELARLDKTGEAGEPYLMAILKMEEDEAKEKRAALVGIWYLFIDLCFEVSSLSKTKSELTENYLNLFHELVDRLPAPERLLSYEDFDKFYGLVKKLKLTDFVENSFKKHVNYERIKAFIKRGPQASSSTEKEPENVSQASGRRSPRPH